MIKVIAGTIFIGSVAHAAANFCQYDEYAFPANFPAYMNGTWPTDKVGDDKNFTRYQINRVMLLEMK